MAEEIGALRAVLALESAAFDRGVASARRSLGSLEGGFQRTGGQVVQFGQRMGRDATAGFRSIERSSGAARVGLQNFGFQVQDVAVQIAGGTSASRALAQQLPQLLSGFGLFGVLLGTASAVLIPFAAYMIGAAEETVTLEKSLDNLGKAMVNLDSASKAAREPVEGLIATYGAYADQARRVQEVNRQLAYLDAASALTATAGAITGMFGSLERLNAEGEQTPVWLQEIEARFGNLNPDSVAAVADALSITTDQAILLTEQMVSLSEAKGPEQQVEALQNVISQLEIATGGAFEMDDATRAVYQSLLDALSAAQKLAAVDLASGVTVAADEAARLATNLFAARQQQIAAAPRDTLPGRRGDPRTSSTQGYGEFKYDGPTLDANNNVVARKGGGGGKSSAQKQANDLQREAARVFDKTRTEAEKYAIEVEKLNTLQARGFIDADTYSRAIKGLKGTLGDAASATKQLSSTFEDVFTSFVTGATSAQEAASNLLGQLAQLFAQSAFKSLIGDGGLFSGLGSLLASANGNVFSKGRMQAFANGGVVNGPTVFPMANGTGLMGEAGPEAIMPLTRVGGKLGVVAKGGGGTTISIDARGAVEGTAVQIERALQRVLPGVVQQSVVASRAAASRGR